uniref:YdbS-like PH domain-containing protein n=1 Tax=Serratia phage Kevin TaxID=3161161 RepID=A0AAU8KWY4_9CAUD
MSRYVDNNLISNETVVYRGRTTWWSAFWPIVFALILLPFTFGFSLLFVVPSVIRILTTEIAITNKRIIVKSGLISRDVVELSVAKVEALNVKQSVWARILRFGTIIVYGAGNQQGKAVGIANALEFRRRFYDTQDSQEKTVGKLLLG